MTDLEAIWRYVSSDLLDLDNLNKHGNVTAVEIKADMALLWIPDQDQR